MDAVTVSKDYRLAAVWGFTEATFFFIVPDVILSWLALERPKRGLTACAPALLGALVGGTLMWVWGSLHAGSAQTVLDALPGIRPDMIRAVDSALVSNGLSAVFFGPLRGVPYKIYAVASGELGIGLFGFLLMSIPARLVRFLLVTLLAAGLRAGPLARFSLRTCRGIHVVSWLLFYVWYFYAMAG
jgi:membrane protein YqaA with SNARE-associated domain